MYLKAKLSYRLFKMRLIGTSKSIRPTSRSAMVFAPHQDDESFGCGGTIALKRAAGVPVKVVYITGGQHGQKVHEGRDPIPADVLAAIRKNEALEALGVLGVKPEHVTFLNYMDGGLRWIDAACQQEIVAKLVNLLLDFRPEEVYVTYRSDVHTDHEASYRLVCEAIRETGLAVDLLEYPIWSLEKARLNFKSPEFKNLKRLPIGNARAIKSKAIVSFWSQCEPIGGLDETFLKHLSTRYEFFFKHKMGPPVSKTQPPITVKNVSHAQH